MSCVVENMLSGGEHHLARGLAYQKIKLLKINNVNTSLQLGWSCRRGHCQVAPASCAGQLPCWEPGTAWAGLGGEWDPHPAVGNPVPGGDGRSEGGGGGDGYGFKLCGLCSFAPLLCQRSSSEGRLL